MKFLLFVEGQTEAEALPRFFRKWLDLRLPEPVSVQPIPFRGSGHYVKDIAQKVRSQMASKAGGEVIACVGLLDLYGLPETITQNHANWRKLSVAERVSRATQTLEQRVNHSKFRQFFAVHELEAWLLSQPELFPWTLKRSLEPLALRPEEVNFTRPPAVRLGEIYRKEGRDFKKTADSVTLFQRLDPHSAAQSCPYLREMLETLLTLAQEANH